LLLPVASKGFADQNNFACNSSTGTVTIDSKRRSSVMNTISEAMNMFAWVIDRFAGSVDYKSATSKQAISLAVVS
jgi:hypothetical protein